MEELTFGTYIRRLRENQQMPLRKLAAALDIDTSTLSKIERQERSPRSSMVPVIAEIFDLNYKELQIFFLKDKLLHDLQEEDYFVEALEQILAQLSRKV